MRLPPVSALLRRAGSAGAVGVGLGVLAAGAAAGLVAERYAVRRPLRAVSDPDAEVYGTEQGDDHPVTTDDGVVLHVEVDEAPSAPDDLTVVLVHGYGHDGRVWTFQRRSLRGQARLVVPDQRGHGRSGRAKLGDAGLDRLGEDLRDVLAAVVPAGPIVLVGHSMGGMAVMALAAAHPELFGPRIVGAVLMATSPGRLTEVTFGVPAAVGRLARRVVPGVMALAIRQADLLERGRQVGSDLSALLTRHYSFASDVPPSLVSFVTDMIDGTSVEVLADFYPAFDAHEKLAALAALAAIPVLVLVGDSDLMTPEDHSRAIAAMLPEAELVVVAHAGHMVLLEHPDIVSEHVLALVERSRGPAKRVAS